MDSADILAMASPQRLALRDRATSVTLKFYASRGLIPAGLAGDLLERLSRSLCVGEWASSAPGAGWFSPNRDMAAPAADDTSTGQSG